MEADRNHWNPYDRHCDGSGRLRGAGDRHASSSFSGNNCCFFKQSGEFILNLPDNNRVLQGVSPGTQRCFYRFRIKKCYPQNFKINSRYRFPSAPIRRSPECLRNGS